MRWSIELPGPDSPAALTTPDAFVSAAQAIEHAGFNAAWVTDHPFPALRPGGPGHHAYDPFTALAFAAAATCRLRMHINLAVLPYRNPFITASAVATLDHLSGGRVIVGAGAGYLREEFDALGSDFDARAKLTRESIAAMKAAWSGGEVTLQGLSWSAAGNSQRPVPLQRPHPPLWRGGNSAAAMAHAIAACDGWSPYEVQPEHSRGHSVALATIDEVSRRVDGFRRLAADLGRGDDLDVCLVRRRTAARWLDQSDQQITEEAAALEKAGVTWVATSLLGACDPTDFADRATRLAGVLNLAGLVDAEESDGPAPGAAQRPADAEHSTHQSTFDTCGSRQSTRP